jgi:hypothetical protein
VDACRGLYAHGLYGGLSYDLFETGALLRFQLVNQILALEPSPSQLALNLGKSNANPFPNNALDGPKRLGKMFDGGAQVLQFKLKKYVD